VLSQYLETSESALKKGAKELAKNLQYAKLDIQGDELTDEDITSTTAISVLNRLAFYRHDIVARMRYGFVIQLYGAFEAEAKSLCKTLNKRKPKLKLQVADLSDFKYIKKAVTVAGASAKLLTEINLLRLLRNSLAHANGCYAESKETQRNAISTLVKSKAGVHISDDGYVEIERQYCEHTLRTVTAFFEELFEKHNFGQVYFFGKTHGYGIKTSPSKKGAKYQLMEREEVARFQKTAAYKRIASPAKTADADNSDLQSDPLP
jgi:hypothetical protein